MAVVGPADEHAYVRADFADVAGERHEDGGRMARNVSVRHLVVAAPADGQAGRP